MQTLWTRGDFVTQLTATETYPFSKVYSGPRDSRLTRKRPYKRPSRILELAVTKALRDPLAKRYKVEPQPKPKPSFDKIGENRMLQH